MKIPDFLKENFKSDKLSQEYKNFLIVEEKYLKRFNGVIDYNCIFVDYGELKEKLKNCIELNIPYKELYGDDYKEDVLI